MGRPKPPVKKRNPKATVIHSYQSADADEITIEENEIIEILSEGKLFSVGLVTRMKPGFRVLEVLWRNGFKAS